MNAAKRKLIIVFSFSIICFSAIGQCLSSSPTYKTKSTGTGVWTTASDWVSQPPYVLSGGAYTIPAGQSVSIENNFTLHSNLIVYGTLLVVGRLDMDAGATITVASGGLVTCCGSSYCGGSCPSCGASDKIAIGGGPAWCGASCGTAPPGPFSGPATLSSSGLPITLGDFSAYPMKDVVELKWFTFSELNFDYFNVEKSINGIDFYTLTKVNGHGTTNERQNYQAFDGSPVIGLNYYRLTSVDFDNYRETFNTVAVHYLSEEKMSLSPNPFNGSELNLKSNIDLSTSGTFCIFDSMGILVSSFTVSENNAVIRFSSPLKSGVYIAKFISPSFSSVTRLVVQ